MALLNTNTINIARLNHETASVALATNGSKTLHIVTSFYYDPEEDRVEPLTEYQITFEGTLESHSDFGMAVERYNEI